MRAGVLAVTQHAIGHPEGQRTRIDQALPELAIEVDGAGVPHEVFDWNAGGFKTPGPLPGVQRCQAPRNDPYPIADMADRYPLIVFYSTAGS